MRLFGVDSSKPSVLYAEWDFTIELRLQVDRLACLCDWHLLGPKVLNIPGAIITTVNINIVINELDPVCKI